MNIEQASAHRGPGFGRKNWVFLVTMVLIAIYVLHGAF